MHTARRPGLDWPLMKNNILREDLDAVCDLLSARRSILTQSANVRAFEEEWSDWLGVRHSVFVNSGSSANLVTLAALQGAARPGGEVIVPTITWVSDIAAVLHAGFKPVFVDIDPRTLGMDNEQVLAKLTPRTRAVFLTHVLGYNALSQRLLDELQRREHPADRGCLRVARSHVRGPQARHVRPGVELLLLLRASSQHDRRRHGLHQRRRPLRDGAHAAVARHGPRAGVRQPQSANLADEYPDLNPDFIFAFPAYNVRSTEINAVIGRSQLQRLDANNRQRTENLRLFLDNLDPDRYTAPTSPCEGSSNYAFTLVLREPDEELCDRVMATLRAARRRVSPRHRGRRQSASPAVPARHRGDRGVEAVIRGRITSISSASTSATIRRCNPSGSWSCASCSTKWR